ncbi:MAG: hypothetical protein AAB583_03355 [Patescibacteria group bacterium]
MTLEPIIFFDLLITIFILAITAIFLAVYLARTMKKLRLYRTEYEKIKAAVAENNSHVLNEARNKAVRIIDEANNKALDVIHKSGLFANITNYNFDKELKALAEKEFNSFEKATSDFVKVYESVLDDLKARNVEIFQKISNNIEISTLEEIKKFKRIIEQETISSQKMIKKKVDHEYSLAKKDIEEYKQSELKIVDEKIYEILEAISKLVLGKAIELSRHEALIIESLEKAKKEGIFDNEK